MQRVADSRWAMNDGAPLSVSSNYVRIGYNFCWSGTTTCVVAGRLVVYDPSLRILILEAGQHTQALSDYDDWGANGWESENLIPLMKKLETYEVQPDRPTHGYDGPIKVSSGGCKMGNSDEFIHVGTTYHKRQYADDTDDLKTGNTYSICPSHGESTLTGQPEDVRTRLITMSTTKLTTQMYKSGTESA
ncbi:hypothetical protein BDR07DRAFT_796200 [Suillus spraguei]|nr:hypothetical protein BDR07DRAFT_796200 [Suillus spraguei]